MSLEQVPLFANLSHDAKQDLQTTLRTESYPASTIIVRQGDTADTMYIIESGRVNVILTNADGDDIPLVSLGPGEYFGEMALIDAEPRSATVITVEPSELLVLRRDNFESALHRHPSIATQLLREMAHRLRNCDHMVKNFVRSDTHGRVTRFLAVFTESVKGENRISAQWTPERIAELVGTNPDNVQNILQSLENEGFIIRDAKGILINQHHLLPKELLLIW